MKILLLSLWCWAALPWAGVPGSIPGSALDPVIEDIARSTVAIRVDREKERPVLSQIRLRLRSNLPKSVIDYYSRPPGPATGLLLDNRGNILTSFYNVSGNLKSIEVVMPSGEARPARLIATDPSDDLALIRIVDPPEGLDVSSVKWGNPERLQVGRFVMVVGRSPDPVRPTATFGIISALGRNGGRAFQTDAELNYGNVGGPIVDLDGSVLGLAGFVGHTYPLWGLNSGIGFGTRVDTIRTVLPELLAGKNIPPPERPFLGVGGTREPSPEGCRIGLVDPESAAARAGIQVNDIVLSMNGEEVEDFMDLRRIINQHRPGDEVVIRVKRGDKELELKAKLGRRPE